MTHELLIAEHWNYHIISARLSNAQCKLACAIKAKKSGKNRLAALSKVVDELTVLNKLARDASYAYAAAY